MRQGGLLTVALAVQALCALFFVASMVVDVFGLSSRPLNWQLRELLEIGAVLGLILGAVLGAIALSRTLALNRRMRTQIRAASGAFHAVMEDRFRDWGLTPAERDVAVFALKGFSLAEIAGLRQTSEGTVKAQSNAIYRKAGVSGRTQLLSVFLDDLMNDVPTP